MCQKWPRVLKLGDGPGGQQQAKGEDSGWHVVAVHGYTLCFCPGAWQVGSNANRVILAGLCCRRCV